MQIRRCCSKYTRHSIRCFFTCLILFSIYTWWFFFTTINTFNLLRYITSSGRLYGKECWIEFPQDNLLVFNNHYWQVLNTSLGRVFIYGAYLDVRNTSSKKLRFITMIDHLKPKVNLSAQIWMVRNWTRGEVFTGGCSIFYMWHEKWGQNSFDFPYLITCELPKYVESRTIESVSLVEDVCHSASNRFDIVHHKSTDNISNFAVCVKGLTITSEDNIKRLMEWIELVSLLGAHKIYLYEIAIHPKVKQMLQYYSQRGMVDLKMASMPYHEDRKQNLVLDKRHNEMIVYNDCFYRNHDKYKYLAVFDTDEALVPLKVSNWTALFDMLRHRFKPGVFKTINSICLNNIYYLDMWKPTRKWFLGVPRHMHMLQHVYRSKNFSKLGYYTKCFHNTNRILLLHNHFAFSCEKKCLYHHLDRKLGQLAHYRSKCHSIKDNFCDGVKNEVVLDFSMWRFQDELTRNVGKALKDLRLL